MQGNPKKLKEHQERNVDRLMHMLEAMNDEKLDDVAKTNAYQSLEMMVEFDEKGAERQVKSVVPHSPEETTAKRPARLSLNELAARQKAMMEKLKDQDPGETHEVDMDTLSASGDQSPGHTDETTDFSKTSPAQATAFAVRTDPPCSGNKEPERHAGSTSAYPANGAGKNAAETPSSSTSSEGERKIELAKRLYFEAARLSKEGKALTENHKKAVAFVQQQKKHYQEAVEFRKADKPLEEAHRAAILVMRMVFGDAAKSPQN